MELRQRHSNYTLMSESYAGLSQSCLPAGGHKNTLRQSADLFGGLLKHPAVSDELRRLLQPVSRHTAAIYSRLFPESPCPASNCTLTLYDRLNIALTVAQLTDISLLCDFYAKHLNPLPGPSGTKESNNRLTEITQYSRQLACSPATAAAPQISRLQKAGLTETDILTLHHLCGFIHWQSRMTAGIMALSGIRFPAVFMAATAPVFPERSTDKTADSKLPAISLNRISLAHLSILRQVSAIDHPQLVPQVLAHAPAAAEAWLILRTTESALQNTPQAASTAFSNDDTLLADLQPPADRFLAELKEIPLRISFPEPEHTLAQGGNNEFLLPKILAVARQGWDQTLGLLS